MPQNSRQELGVQGPATIAVNERTVLVRLNRMLARTSSGVVRKYRALGHGPHSGFGDYYRVDTHSGDVIETHINLEVLARKIGALHCFEEMAVAPHPQHDLLEEIRVLRSARISMVESP